jgi:acetylornithine aminotransferase
VLAVKNSFHGRTSAAVRVTDNPALSAQLNRDNFEVDFIEMNDALALENHLSKGDYCAFILEGIQGVGGLDIPSTLFLQRARTLCDQNNTLLVLDEIQSGFGRSGKFFAHQYAQVEADLITMAKGMGNGFPVAGVLITPKIEAKAGLLGTTFGGNHLACAATIAVLETLEEEALMENALGMEWVFKAAFSRLSQVTVKGKGLMLGLEFSFPVKELRSKLVSEYQIFTGASSNPNLLRILPPLSISKEELLHFCTILKNELS